MFRFKILFVSLLFTCLYSCDKNELMINENQTTASTEDVLCSDFRVDVETAKYAAEFIFAQNVKTIDPIVYHDKDTIMYAINFANGWVLLSADTRAKNVLASSEEGTFDQQELNQGTVTLINQLANDLLELKRDKNAVPYSVLQGNDDYVFWHNMYLGRKTLSNDAPTSKNNVKLYQVATRPEITSTNLYLCKKLIKQENLGTTYRLIGDRMVTKWGQGDKYAKWNINLPFVPDADGNAVYPPVGCTAVAMGQVIYHAHYKLNTPLWLYHGSKIEGVYYNEKNYNMNFTQGQYVANSPRWDLMAKHYYESSEKVGYVAELFADLDWRLKMDYGYDASGSNISKDVMNQFGLTYDEDGFNSKIIEQNLENSLPVMITSFRDKGTTGWWLWKKTTYSSGHAWVVDGLSETTTHTKNTYKWCLVEVAEQNNKDNSTILNERTISTIPIQFEEAPEYYYTSLSDVYNDFESVMVYDKALQQGKKPRLEETSTINKSSRKYLMNWGWDGLYDDNEYELTATNWQIGSRNYQYNTKIYYNLRKE